MTTFLRTRKCFCLLAWAALLLALVGCAREPETALRIGTNVWIGSEPLYLARELGQVVGVIVVVVVVGGRLILAKLLVVVVYE